MATSGVLEDFARMPNDRKTMVFVVAGVLLALIYWKLVYKSLGDSLDAAEADHASKVSTDKKLAEDLPKYEDLRLHMTKLRELIEKNQTALPSEAEVPAFFETLQHKVSESGAEIHKWTKRNEEPVESFVKVPVDVELTGTFMQLKRFFASLVQNDVEPRAGEDQGGEDRERVVSIEDLTIGNPTVRNREIVLSAKFTAVTFRQEDKPIPAAPTPGQPAPPASAAPPPSAPPLVPSTPSAPPPPLPSAATPAGARARVESSLEKGDAKDRAAAGVGDARPGNAKPGNAKPGAGSNRLKGGL